MRKRLVSLLCVLIICSGSSLAFDLGASFFASTVRMNETNAMIALYNDINDSDIRSLSSSIGVELYGSAPTVSWIGANVGLRMQGARTGADREKVTTSSIGMFAGPQVSLGAWTADVDLGLNRTSFSFPASFYESLRGWSLSLTSAVGYSFRVLRTFSTQIAARFQWMPVYRLRDSDGGVYQAREGAFLNYTGIGFTVKITWKR